LKQVVEFLRSGDDRWIVDATVGFGGHSEALLEASSGARLLGIDRDPRALERARERLTRFGDRVRLVEGRHESLIEILRDSEVNEPGIILADLGVSSMQLDDAARGFSFRFEGPLDMRMGDQGATAADLVGSLDIDELTRILREYGEEPMARKIARAIVEAREVEPILTTSQLAEIVRKAKPQRGDRIDPATLTFQALRIATNEELVGLEQFVEDAVEVLGKEGRVGIIAFHSLEDRIVKRLFRRLEGECSCPPDLPVCGCGAVEVIRVLTHRPLGADESEIAQNPRSRSAKLRIAEKL